MKNNNKAVIAKLAKRSLKVNVKRNIFIVVAIVLTTLMLTSVFSIGMSIVESINTEKVRLMGTVAHAIITQPTAEELEKLKNLDYVKEVGTGNHVAQVKTPPQMNDMDLNLFWHDSVDWEQMRLPALSDIVGSYPQAKNEIMVPRWILERMGITPEIGKTIHLSYIVEENGEAVEYSRDFVLSGWFTSFMHIRLGNIDTILVSELFSQEYGKTAEKEGSASIIFNDNTYVYYNSEQLEYDLGITDPQRVSPAPMYDSESSSGTTRFFALALIVAFLILTGYLLIYNVLYISVAKDIRFYGLLKTIGTTSKQIRGIMLRQILRLWIIGAPIGIALASILSLVIVPAVISTSTIETDAVISFSPIIYIASIIFSLITALLGASKPAKKAANISPVEAQKYTETIKRKSVVRSQTHGSPYRMAARNIFRDRKRAVVVLLSMFLALTTFISITTVITSMDLENYIDYYLSNDFVLTNNTTSLMSGEDEAKQKFDDEFLEKIRNINGFKDLNYDTSGIFSLTYNSAFEAYAKKMLEIKQNEQLSADELEELKNAFTSIAVGVDSRTIEDLDGDFDIEAFKKGEFLLLSVEDPLLVRKIDEVEINAWPDGGVLENVPVKGFAPYFFHNNTHSFAPTLIMSNELMQRLTGDAMRSVLYIDVEKGYEEEFFRELKLLTDDDYEISRQSKIEMREELKNTKMLLYILGGGIALILGLIGVLNFVNIMSVGIMVRKRELAILESIGMTRKEIRKMLLGEGIGYAIITLCAVATIGNAIAYMLFKMFQQEATYAIFTYPVIPIIIMALAIVVVCIITPARAYNSLNKSSIVERLRENE